jgi:hypothetical protein
MITPQQLAQLFENQPHSDWVLCTIANLPLHLQNKDYVWLQCKTCERKRQHSVGNIKYMLLHTVSHCRCQYCYQQWKKKTISINILALVEATLKELPGHTWLLDRSLIHPNEYYHSKTPLPLLCKNCGTTVCHSPGNIHTLKKNPLHIVCQECKSQQALKRKFEQKVNGQYILDPNSTNVGYQIIHVSCGYYHYCAMPLLAKVLCPFCFSDKNAFSKLKDQESINIFINKYAQGRVSCHGSDSITKLLRLSCKIHPENGIYELDWNAFLRGKRNAKIYSCRLCMNQRLRQTSFEEYNTDIAASGLRIDYSNGDLKIYTKEKLLHYCSKTDYHPPFQASPYEVQFKKKRCAYCYALTSYQKDFYFLKHYIEMDQDRFITHSGRKFRLLSSPSEIEAQKKPFKHYGAIKIRINELTCSRHSEYTTTWGNFYYRNAGCQNCNAASSVSYAHTYFQALLNYYDLKYIPEYPIKTDGKNRLRVDFKLETIPNYVEIDSVIHVRGWDKNSVDGYRTRDERKDTLLEGNLERIKLYDDNDQVLPLKEQLEAIENAFLERAYRNGLPITPNDIKIAKTDPIFFNNSGITALMLKLQLYHGGHIEFKDNHHVNLLLSKTHKECEFICIIHQQSFKRHPRSVFKYHFLCPVCACNIFNGSQHTYYLDAAKKILIYELINQRFKYRLTFESTGSDQAVFFYNTLVFPVTNKWDNTPLYLSLNDLLSRSVQSVINNVRKGKYKRYVTAADRASKPDVMYKRSPPVEIHNIPIGQRLKLHAKCQATFNIYQQNAKQINRLMKKTDETSTIQALIRQNHADFNEYYHETERYARSKLSTFDRHVLPFFNRQSLFELHTLRHQYVDARQFLLIKDTRCGHFFYLSWNWLKVKHNKGLEAIQCQHAACYAAYYRTRNPGARKISQNKILLYFRLLYHGQYYPVSPDTKIMVREPISIVHLPTGLILTVSVDNFRRGKFRCKFKKLTKGDLKRYYPTWKHQTSSSAPR